MTGPAAFLDDSALMAEMVEIERADRSLHLRRLECLAEAVRRGLDSGTGDKTLFQWYCHATRVDQAQVRRWMTQIGLFRPSLTPTGASVAAKYHRVAEALDAGELSDKHLDVLASAVPNLPEWAEATLAEYARSTEPAAVRALARRIKDQVEQDAKDELDEAEADPRNTLYLRDKPGGRLEFWGELCTEAAAEFRAMLEPLSEPSPASELGPDPRTLPERQGDAFADLIRLAMRSADLPSEAGQRPHVSVTVDLKTLETGLGHALLDGGSYISAAQARRLACDAKLIPVVLGGNSEVLDLGRSSRDCSIGLRRALHIRDRGCSFPGCDRPPKWCDAHHVKYWADGGPTEIGNMVLLCGQHHRTIHHSEWEIEMVNGMPLFHPPAAVDPQRRPRQNVLHHHAA